MAKKHDQSSGPSYSLLALLKRALFLHETSHTDELVEEVHEHMLRDQAYEQVKKRYVAPILRHNQSFREIEEGQGVWKLTEGNRVNDAVYEVFVKYHSPLSERQILNRLAKIEQLDKLNVALDLKNDARFSDLEGGKYWILSEWIVVNDYARSILLKNKQGLPEKDLLARVVDEYGVDEEKAIFLPMLDQRFVKKDRNWVLKRYTDQKTKLRASKIDRLYNHLLNAGGPLTDNELTVAVLNMPASSTDVQEKLTDDPRFVFENGKWDIRSRVEERKAAILRELETERPEPPEYEVPIQPAIQEEPPTIEAPEKSPALFPEDTPLVEDTRPDLFEAVREELAAESEKEEAVSGTSLLLPGQPEEPEAVQEPEDLEAPQEPEEPEPLEEPLSMQEEDEVLPEGEAPETQMDEYLETLRTKVVEFLQDAFHAEGVIYNADIIDQFVNSEEREELFEDFVEKHFPDEAKGRLLTDRAMIKFMVYLSEATLNDKIIDPCCGSGGFLLYILEMLDAYLQEAEWTERDFSIHYELRTGQFYFVQMSEEEQSYFEIPLADDVAKWLPIIRFCKQQQLTGVDIDRFAYRTADLNLAIAGFPAIVLHQDNTLISKQIGSGVYDIVIGTPPAAGDLPTRFLRKSLLLARPGGKILLLLPDEMFDDSRLVSSSLRNQLASQTIIRAVIRLPEPPDRRLYGPRRTLLYCFRKHRDTEQQSAIFTGQLDEYEDLQELNDVLEFPDVPVSQRETPIAGDVVNYILSSYQGSAYNLFLEGLRREVLHGELLDVKEWTRLEKRDDGGGE